MTGMRPRVPVPLAAALAIAVALAVPPSLRAETRDPRTLTLGWLVERASVVALVTVDEAAAADGVGTARVRIDEVLRGSALRAGEGATLVLADRGHGLPWVVGARHIAFLEPAPAAPDGALRWTPVSGFHGMKRVVDGGAEGRFPDLVRAYAALLDDDGAPRDRAAFRALLVAWMGDPDAGVRWSAAVDFVRHGRLREGMTAEESGRVVAAFRAAPAGKEDRAALAVAAGHARGPGAAAALVDALLEDGAPAFRGGVAEGLRRLADPGATARIEAALERAPAARRADLLFALGRAGDPAAGPVALARAADADATVRFEAVHATGLLARAARAADPERVAPGRAELLARFEAATADPRERRAALWALVQLDDPEAFAAVRRIAAEHADAGLREEAARRLRAPRESLLVP